MAIKGAVLVSGKLLALRGPRKKHVIPHFILRNEGLVLNEVKEKGGIPEIPGRDSSLRPEGQPMKYQIRRWTPPAGGGYADRGAGGGSLIGGLYSSANRVSGSHLSIGVSAEPCPVGTGGGDWRADAL